MSTPDLNTSNRCTHSIRVETESFFVPEHSELSDGLYFFAYRIRITNEGEEPVKLVSRYWKITDGLGRVEEVRGSGVVGEQPRLSPGESFEYTSFCPLPTPRGSMHGTYQMVRDSGEPFEVAIGTFKLYVRYSLN